MELKKYKLGELIDVKRGTSLAGEHYATSGDLIRLTCGNFDYNNNCFKENTSKDDIYYTAPVREEYIMNEGDIITPLTEQAIGLLGSTAIVPESGKYIQSQDVAKIICKEKLIDHDFAFYLISSSVVKKQLSVAAQQTKIRHTSPDKIKDCVVWIPSLQEQKQIASVLSNLDRKIALNRAINRNLEAMAKQLYDYWFVQFDFPNAEGKPYKSSGGKMVRNDTLKREIPEGWEVLNFESLFEIGNGKTIPDSEGLFPAYGGNGIVKYIGESNYDACFVIGRVGANCGSVHYSPIPCWVSDNAIAITPRNIQNSPYLLNTLKLYDLSQGKGGSSQPLITHAGLKRLLFPFLKSVVNKYCEIANLQLNMFYKNLTEIQTLTEQRDTLLPLLMNGQVSVTQLNSDLSAC